MYQIKSHNKKDHFKTLPRTLKMLDSTIKQW